MCALPMRDRLPPQRPLPSTASVGVGSVIDGRYRVDGLVAEGGIGLVVQAIDFHLERRVAIKTLLPEFADNDEAIQRFRREARAGAKIQSEHVARVIDVGTLQTGAPYMVMEFLDGLDLSQVIAEEGPLPVADAALYVIQACEALAEAHGYGIIHRDLKPANLFLANHQGGGRRLKVLDFGIAKILSPEPSGPLSSLTRTSSMMGSMLYMSPEQMKSARDVDLRTDIWGLGVILYELLSGEPPFTGNSIPEVSANILLKEPRPLHELMPEIPSNLSDVIGRLLRKRPDERFQNVGQLALALLAFAPARARENVERIIRVLNAPQPLDVVGVDLRSTGALPKPWAAVSADTPLARSMVSPVQPDRPPSPAVPQECAEYTTFREHLPLEFQPNAQPLFGCFQAEFGEIVPSGPVVVSLRNAKAEDAPAHDYLAVFTGRDEPVIGPSTFLGTVGRLEAVLRTLDQGRDKVVFAISGVDDLGPGVQGKILEYRRKYRARVVPLRVQDVVQAFESGSCGNLLRDRLIRHDLPNVFCSPPAASPMGLVGLRDEIIGLASLLEGPGAMVSVHGLPGSGKSSLMRMMAFELSGVRLCSVQCAELATKTITALVREVVSVVRPQLPNPRDAAPWAAFESISPGCQPFPILVLEDADWVIAELSSDDSMRACEAREFWTMLVRLASQKNVRWVVTSVNGFVLEHRKIREWENPMPSSGLRVWPLALLDSAALARLVEPLAAQSAASFTATALTEIASTSAGHVGVALQICRHALDHRRRATRHPLSRVRVTHRDVRKAARELAEMAPTFQDRLLAWYSAEEREILHVLATTRIRALHQLESALPNVGPTDLKRAFSRLQENTTLTFEAGRHRIRIPLFETWLQRHAERHKGRRRFRPRAVRALSWSITAAVTGAMLHSHAASARAVASPARDPEGCPYDLVYPASVMTGTEFTVQVRRHQCSVQRDRDEPLFLRGVGNTMLSGEGEILVPLNAERSIANVQLAVDRGPVGHFTLELGTRKVAIGLIDIERSCLQELATRLTRVLQDTWVVPVFMGFLFAYNGRMRTLLRRMYKALLGAAKD